MSQLVRSCRWGFALLALSALCAEAGRPHVAMAEPASAATQACLITGRLAAAKDLQLFDAARGGEAIAQFSGAETTLTVLEFPEHPNGLRAKVRTGSSAGGFEVNGYLDPTRLSLVAARQLAVVPGHVWLNQGVPLRFEARRGGRLKVAARLPHGQAVSAWAACDAIGLGERGKPGWQVPGSARGYLSGSAPVNLRKSPNGPVAFTLQPATPGRELLFWSTESRGSFVHVVLHEDLVVDAWVAGSELEALPEGERVSRLTPATSVRNPARLQFAQPPRMFRATRSVALRAKATKAAPVIGRIIPNTEVYVIDVIAGWASVLPRRLDLVAPAGGQFWVESSELGL